MCRIEYYTPKSPFILTSLFPTYKGCDLILHETLKKIVFVVVICFVAVVFFFLTNDSSVEQMNHKPPETLAVAVEEEVNASNLSLEKIVSDFVMVDIKGEVNKPGVYELPIDSRVKDVIDFANGFTADANETQINLAQKVYDEMIIIVPKLGGGEEGETSETSSGSMIGGKLRINVATQEEIETLSGIGPSKAQAIIKHREENGLFKVPEDLLQVSGIGEKTLQNFIDQIQIP